MYNPLDDGQLLHKLKHCYPQTWSKDTVVFNTIKLSNGTVIENEGIYSDTLINMDGCDSILRYKVTFGNIEDALNKLKLGPVPTLKDINIISSHFISNCKMTLFNDLGQVVWCRENIDISPPLIQLPLNNNQLIPSAFYILRIENSGKHANFKLIVAN